MLSMASRAQFARKAKCEQGAGRVGTQAGSWQRHADGTRPQRKRPLMRGGLAAFLAT